MRGTLTMTEAANLYGQVDPVTRRPMRPIRASRAPGKPQAGSLCMECLSTGCAHRRRAFLSPQLQRVALLLITPLCTKEIATTLGLELGTTKIYLSRLYSILGVQGARQAAIWAYIHQAELRAALGESPEAEPTGTPSKLPS